MGGSAGSLGDSLTRMSARGSNRPRPMPMFGDERASVDGGGGKTLGTGFMTSTRLRFDSTGGSSSIPRFNDGVLSLGWEDPRRGKGLGGERLLVPFRADWGEDG